MIEINGKAYPVHFGMRQIMAFDGIAPDGKLDIDALIKVMQAVIKRGCDKAGVPFTLSAIDIEDALDDDPELLERFTELLQSSKTFQHFASKAEDSEGK